MADHGEVQYTTADGNDYREHEATYVRFIEMAFSLSAYVIAILLGLAVVGATKSPMIGVGVIVIASILVIPAIFTSAKGWSYASIGLGLLGLAVASLG
jgi:hypothetical protein